MVGNTHTDLKIAARHARQWAVHRALPFWAHEGRGGKGSFYEDMTLRGAAKPQTVRRLRVQARQIYVYSHAHHLGWFKGQDVVEDTMHFMNSFHHKDGGYIHLINPDFTVKDDRRDFYDHAFYLLALAWHGRVFNPASLQRADKLLSFIDETMGADEGYTEGIPPSFPRRQNPHMHLFEALLALYDATGDERYLYRATKIFQLFKRYFYDAERGRVCEYFGHDWLLLKRRGETGVEPGHAAEWIWLLRGYEKRTGVDVGAYADALYDNVMAHSGSRIWLIDECHPDETPMRSTRRLWVQCELLKAHLAQAEAGTEHSADMAAAILTGLTREYLRSDGLWNDQFGPEGTMISDSVPASTFYHIFSAITEAYRIAGLQETS